MENYLENYLQILMNERLDTKKNTCNKLISVHMILNYATLQKTVNWPTQFKKERPSFKIIPN